VEIDVVMCSWNSNKPFFHRCLESIKREIPVHHFILVDRYSNDGTVDEVKKHFDRLKIIKSNANLGRARALGIQFVDTEYFAFIDSDVELPKGWFPRLMAHMNNKIGAIHEHLLPDSVTAKWLKWQLKRQPKPPITDITSSSKEISNYLNSTILKTDLVEDWSPDLRISAYEAYLLMKHIVNKGYIWRVLNSYTIKHHALSTLKKQKWLFVGSLLTGHKKTSIKKLIFESIKPLLKAFMAAVTFKEPRILLRMILQRTAFIDAYLRWNKFVVLERQVGSRLLAQTAKSQSK